TGRKSHSPGGQDYAAAGGGPAPRLKGSTKAPQRVVGGKTRRGLPALPLRPKAVTPRSDRLGPGPRANSASGRRARPRLGAS
ncbi:hypothetical protein P7K49_020839, partial [Saguinus oedipus]